VPEGLPSDSDFKAMLQRERIQQLADQELDKRYGEYPELNAYAEERSEVVCSSLRDTFGPSVPFPRDAEDTLHRAYKKLYFMFTDPYDHRDTPPNSMLYTLSEEVMSSQSEVPPNITVFATSLNHLACQLFLMRRVLEARGDLEDIAPRDQLFYVKYNLDLLSLGADRSQSDEDPDSPTDI